MHVHTGCSLLAVPLRAWERAGKAAEPGSRHPFRAPAPLLGLIPATLVPSGCPGGGQARHSPLRSSARGNAGKGGRPVAGSRPRAAAGRELRAPAAASQR